MDLPQSTPQDAAVFCYELMDFSDISSDLPDIMMTTSDDYIPDLVNISDSECLDNIQHRVWFALTLLLTKIKITIQDLYIMHAVKIVYTLRKLDVS